MSRRKITDEAEEAAEADQDEIEDGSESKNNDDGDDESDRKQLTQRMPEDLVEEVDEVSNDYGMSRNDAINMMVRQWLNDRR